MSRSIIPEVKAVRQLKQYYQMIKDAQDSMKGGGKIKKEEEKLVKDVVKKQKRKEINDVVEISSKLVGLKKLDEVIIEV